MHEFIYVIEWKPRNKSLNYRYWSHRFTEKAARRWIEREQIKHKNIELRLIRYIREDNNHV